MVDWPLLWSIQLATEDQLEAEGQVGKSEGELSLEKDVKLTSTLPAAWLEDKVSDQDNKVEALPWWAQLPWIFANLGGHKLPWIKV